MYTLLLRLGGPLQSWGSSSYYDTRETDYMPTKSAVTGILAAALGRSRDETPDDLGSLRFGVRVDMAGSRLNDFQITDMGEKLNKNISNRVYLSDALFLAGFGSEDRSFLEKLEDALENPKFALFLGRRSCPPTVPVNMGIKDLELYEALLNEPWLVPEWRQPSILKHNKEISLRIVTEVQEEGCPVKKDVPVSFSPFRRQYGYRYIKEMPPKILKSYGGLSEHDPMKELG